ncbi:ABC transporter substrate-binding protein [Rhodococcus daqingensis]|uniref:ABC transporter substrate-binding protein n=1 Tax=Rhodococcus daqingensis TaxID=2479363 RepID=A0ABW2S709_9NOCA
MATSVAPLRVGSALPDPPFELLDAGKPTGFDVEFTRELAARLDRPWQLVPFTGSDFNEIFTALRAGAFDCIASGTTITPERAGLADFCSPYFTSGQSLAVDVARHPNVRGVDDLAGLTIGVQRGNTSAPIAERLVADGKAAGVHLYEYHQIGQAIDDLSTGRCDAVMKLAPVLTWLVRDRPHVVVVQRDLSREEIAIAVRAGDRALRERIEEAQRTLEADGTLGRLTATWLGG